MYVTEDPMPPSAVGRAAVSGRRTGQALRDLVALARPGQWPKNLLVVPLALLDAPAWTAAAAGRAMWAAAVFTLFSSAGYVVNDIADRHRDGRHPAKRTRPMAAGRLGLRIAWAYAAALGCLGGALLAAEPPVRWWPIPVYGAVTVAYSLKLKHVPLADVFVIGICFLLRVGEGYAATGVHLTPWLPTCVFCLCLMLVLGKRRHELAEAGPDCRPALRGYSVPFLDQLIVLTAALACAGFLQFVRAEAPLGSGAGTVALACAPLALFGLARYLQILTVEGGGANPVRTLLRDRRIVTVSLALAAVLGTALIAAHDPALAPSILHRAV